VAVAFESVSVVVGRPFVPARDVSRFYKTRAHARALETLTFGLRRCQERFLLVTGDLGTGKTVLCRALVESLGSTRPVSLVSSPLADPSDLYRRLLEDFGSSGDEARLLSSDTLPLSEWRERLVGRLSTVRRRRGGPVIVVDDAHTMPAIVIEQLLALSAMESSKEQPLQIVLVGRARPDGSGVLGVRALDELVSTRTRLTSLTRDECERYVHHRLSVAGCNPELFTPRAIGVLHRLSGGIPRLLNLIAERAIQLTNGQGAQQIDSGDVAAVASSLDAVSTRPRRFRWFARRVS
jgi:type II secretory pathway predicted ATPase ExeA